MGQVEDGAGAASGLLSVIKDLPLWVLAGLAVGTDVLLLVPYFAGALPSEFRPWTVIGAVLSNILALARAVDLVRVWLKAVLASRALRRTFHISPDGMQAHWSMHRQKDDSTTTQIDARFLVKNLTDAPLGLVSPRLIKPRIKGEILHADVLVRAQDRNLYGTTLHSGHRIPPKGIAQASLHMMIRGTPKQSAAETLRAKFGLVDDEGNEQQVDVVLKGFVPSEVAEPATPSERVFSIADPIEKQVVSVLQSEIGRYNKHGRERGAFGSLHIVQAGRTIASFAQDSWTSDSPRNQVVSDNPSGVEIASDNLAALFALYERLSSEAERAQFVLALLDRLDASREYYRIAYFIVCVLWKIGRLDDALKKAGTFPENEIKVLGLSNVLYLINGLLRHCHSQFTAEQLDQIENFIHQLKKEHTFLIAEKLAAIRAARLLSG